MLAWFHAIVQERRNYIPQVNNILQCNRLVQYPAYKCCIKCGKGTLPEIKIKIGLFFRAGQSSTSLLLVICVRELISSTDFVQRLVSELLEVLRRPFHLIPCHP